MTEQEKLVLDSIREWAEKEAAGQNNRGGGKDKMGKRIKRLRSRLALLEQQCRDKRPRILQLPMIGSVVVDMGEGKSMNAEHCVIHINPSFDGVKAVVLPSFAKPT